MTRGSSSRNVPSAGLGPSFKDRDEQGFRDVGRLARLSAGMAQAQVGHAAKGADWYASGTLLGVPMLLTWLVEAQALGGALAENLRKLDDALTVNASERFWHPETVRGRCEIRRLQGEEAPAETDYPTPARHGRPEHR
jgi:hypothetical protein